MEQLAPPVGFFTVQERAREQTIHTNWIEESPVIIIQLNRESKNHVKQPIEHVCTANAQEENKPETEKQ
jgi:hypothetical protein